MKKIIVRRTQHETAVHDLPAHLHPVLRRVYLARKLHAACELECSLDRLLPFTSLQGTDAAVELLVAALHEQKRLLIVADFDADGATSCAVVVRALRLLGARNVHYVVPNRSKYGYGLTPEIVAVAADQRPDLLFTVDNGISSLDGVAAAKARGMQVLLTAHHLAGAHLPEADAIVNPNQPGDMFASKSLAGVGVIFYVMLALRARLRAEHWFARSGIEPPTLAQLHRPLLRRYQRLARNRRPQFAATGRGRSRFRRRPAPQCCGPARGHVARHRLSAPRRRRRGARSGGAAHRAQSRTPRPRAADARRGAGEPGRAAAFRRRCRAARRPLHLSGPLASGRDRHTGVAHQGPLAPAGDRLRARRCGRAQRCGARGGGRAHP